MIRKPITVHCAIGIIVLAAGYAGPSIANDDASETGYVSLFNGKNLDGWVIENDARFSVRDGLLTVDKGTGWLRSEKDYGDFIFKMDFRFLEEKANSGIFVRTGPTSKDDDNGWPDNGYQVQCMDIISGPSPCATMIPYGAPPFKSESDLAKLAKAYRPAGKWNSYEIRCDGEELSVSLNGELVTKASDIKNLRGHLGIQAEHGRLEFRNLRIMVTEGPSSTKKSLAKIVGNWDMLVAYERGQEAVDYVLRITKVGDQLQGVLVSPRSGDHKIKSVVWKDKDNVLDLRIERDLGGAELELQFDAKLSEKGLSGEVSIVGTDELDGTWTAKKKKQ